MTHRQQINAAAAAIATADGWKMLDGYDFVTARENYETDRVSSRTLRFLALAEAAFEAITGDRPDYAEDEEENAKSSNSHP